MKEQILKWSPIYKFIQNISSNENNLLLAISPFIKLDALKKFLDNFPDTKDLKIVVRWKPEDIIYGASDLTIFPFLESNKIPLYLNQNIHLKLFVFNSNNAFHTSANITSKGLGYIDNHNVEIGCTVDLALEDWSRIYSMIDCSCLVDGKIYEKYCKFSKEHKNIKQKIPPFIFPQRTIEEFSLSSLPASADPNALWLYYYEKKEQTFSKEAIRKFIHDIVLYSIPSGLNKADFLKKLCFSFKENKFVKTIILLIQKHGSARFGLVNEWIHINCSDVPLPYRWGIKANTEILYNWLDFFYDEITWNVPGKRSQVIYWNRLK